MRNVAGFTVSLCYTVNIESELFND